MSYSWLHLVIGLATFARALTTYPAPIYPQKSPQDAPYDLPESKLKAQVYVPPGFTYGKIPALLLVPGSGINSSVTNFDPNISKLFKGSNFADPVFVNVPDNDLDDVQTNSEYVAYAINYVSSITRSKISVLSWSAGAINVRWANKYWPSTRDSVTTAIAFSPDYHGTTTAFRACSVPCPPATIQQTYNSTFILTLLNNGGDSAYVPTTNFFSSEDEVVQPQGNQSLQSASGFSNDARHVGVSNILLQDVCRQAASRGAAYNSHAGTLYNAVAVGVAQDAIKNRGPAQMKRINAANLCTKAVADGLNQADINATDQLVPELRVNAAGYAAKVTVEPAIKAYAKKDVPKR